jgi:hypothetical protein
VTLFTHRNAGGRCPCGAENAACGPPSDVVPVDQLIEEVAAVSGPLKKYRVKRGGVETVMKLSDADAERLGVGVDDVVGAASTIQPVEPVDDSDGGDGDGSADDADSGQAAAAGDTGASTEPVQSAADSGGDEPEAAASVAPSAGGDPQEAAVTEQTTSPAAAEQSGTPARKTAAPKKRTPSANKARTAAANKAESPGG